MPDMMISQVKLVCYNGVGKMIIEGMTMLKDIDTNREYLTTPQAAERSGLSKVYLAQLLRKGTLEGFQVGRDWCVYTDSLEKFLATPRKSGPKGPIKKTAQKQQNEMLTNENTV
jgi:excisionase family DNA binding protein